VTFEVFNNFGYYSFKKNITINNENPIDKSTDRLPNIFVSEFLHQASNFFFFFFSSWTHAAVIQNKMNKDS